MSTIRTLEAAIGDFIFEADVQSTNPISKFEIRVGYENANNEVTQAFFSLTKPITPKQSSKTVIEPKSSAEVAEPKSSAEIVEPEQSTDVIDPKALPKIIDPNSSPEVIKPTTKNVEPQQSLNNEIEPITSTEIKSAAEAFSTGNPISVIYDGNEIIVNDLISYKEIGRFAAPPKIFGIGISQNNKEIICCGHFDYGSVCTSELTRAFVFFYNIADILYNVIDQRGFLAHSQIELFDPTYKKMSAITSFAVSPSDNQMVTIGFANGTISLITKYKFHRLVYASQSSIVYISFSPCGNCFITRDFDGYACVWNLNGMRIRDISKTVMKTPILLENIMNQIYINSNNNVMIEEFGITTCFTRGIKINGLRASRDRKIFVFFSEKSIFIQKNNQTNERINFMFDGIILDVFIAANNQIFVKSRYWIYIYNFHVESCIPIIRIKESDLVVI